MDITIQKTLFLEKISSAARFTGNRISSSPILQGIYLKISGEAIQCYATDLNQYIHTSIPIPKQTEEKVCIIEPKKVIEFVQLLNDKEIELSFSEKQMRISQGKTRGNFPFMVAEDFPLPPEIKTAETVKIDQTSENLSLVMLAASKDDSRPVLTGVYFHERDDHTIFVSTDGFRLSLIREAKKSSAPPLIIPAAFFNYIQSTTKKKIELSILKEEKMIAAKTTENETVYTRMIEGEFPPYERVLPTETKTTVTVEREGFLRNIKLVSVFAREFSNVLVCEFKKEGVMVRPKKENNQDNVAFQEAKVSGEDQTVAFNYRYLLDFLNAVKTEDVVIEILRADAPVVFKVPNNEQFLHIIMPIRIQE